MTPTTDAGRSGDTAQSLPDGTTPASDGVGGFSQDQEHIHAIRGCWSLAKLDALIWKRRNTTPQPTDAERNAWREQRAKLMRAKA